MWLDAQLSPAIGAWLEEAFDITEAFAAAARHLAEKVMCHGLPCVTPQQNHPR
jgi:hypothetical protein